MIDGYNIHLVQLMEAALMESTHNLSWAILSLLFDFDARKSCLIVEYV